MSGQNSVWARHTPLYRKTNFRRQAIQGPIFSVANTDFEGGCDGRGCVCGTFLVICAQPSHKRPIGLLRLRILLGVARLKKQYPYSRPPSRLFGFSRKGESSLSTGGTTPARYAVSFPPPPTHPAVRMFCVLGFLEPQSFRAKR
jgi:hypothetical protein